MVNNGQHFDLVVKRADKHRILLVKLQFGNITYASDPVKLSVSGNGSNFTFSYAQQKEFNAIETMDSRYLSSETVGGFTCVYVGLYATGNGKAGKSWAEYDNFDYDGNNGN